MKYNLYFPFAEIIETKTYPYARTLRTSLLHKIRDTYNVLVGESPILARNPHVGIIDYLTLFIPTSLLFLMGWCNARRNFIATSLVVPLVLINIPLLIGRIAFGVVATLLFSPITAIVHGISRPAAAQNYTKALNLVGQLKHGCEQRLGDYLTEHHIDIEELDIKLSRVEKKEKIGSGTYQLMFWRKPREGEDFDDFTAPFSVEIRQENGTNVKQAANIHALFKLNVGDVVRHIEEATIPHKKSILTI